VREGAEEEEEEDEEEEKETNKSLLRKKEEIAIRSSADARAPKKVDVTDSKKNRSRAKRK